MKMQILRTKAIFKIKLYIYAILKIENYKLFLETHYAIHFNKKNNTSVQILSHIKITYVYFIYLKAFIQIKSNTSSSSSPPPAKKEKKKVSKSTILLSFN